MSRVWILHENPDWIPPLREALDREGVPFGEILLGRGSLDLDTPPEPGVYWSRLSASAHTRGHGTAKEHARALLDRLERAGRRVVNGSRVAELEVSKVRQHAALRAAGIDVPRTIVVLGRDDLAEQGRRLPAPFITKHNQGGKGLGVRRFDSHQEFDDHLASPLFEEPIDGITLLQEYLQPAEPFITRAEFVGGRFVYAVRVDVSAGAFELCPADACVIDPVSGKEIPVFSLREGLDADPLIADLERFLQVNDIEVAGVEFTETVDGRRVVYDVNTNTNYNAGVEAVAPVPAARVLAGYLGELLQRDRTGEREAYQTGG